MKKKSLSNAIYKNNLYIAENILDQISSLDETDYPFAKKIIKYRGFLSFILAVANQHDAIAQKILDASVLIDPSGDLCQKMITAEECTAFNSAIQSNSFIMVKSMIEKSIEIDTSKQLLRSLLEHKNFLVFTAAAAVGDLELTTYLIEKTLDADPAGHFCKKMLASKDCSAFNAALRKGYMGILSLIIKTALQLDAPQDINQYLVRFSQSQSLCVPMLSIQHMRQKESSDLFFQEMIQYSQKSSEGYLDLVYAEGESDSDEIVGDNLCQLILESSAFHFNHIEKNHDQIVKLFIDTSFEIDNSGSLSQSILSFFKQLKSIYRTPEMNDAIEEAQLKVDILMLDVCPLSLLTKKSLVDCLSLEEDSHQSKKPRLS